MAQVLVKGTAWERSWEDYAYAVGLDKPGWAWEFLRLNPDYQRDFRTNKAGTPTATKHVSGTVYYRLRRKFLAAERWGLIMFTDPFKTSFDAHVHWHPNSITRHVFCIAKPANDNPKAVESLFEFVGRSHVLVSNDHEHLCIQCGTISARLMIGGASLLVQDCELNFQIEGLDRLSSVTETLASLRRLKSKQPILPSTSGQTELRLRECLVALDGHLAGRSYRDIAEVLYGPDRVKEVWTNETRHLKDKVRRAVAAGIDYMNGGYLKLLQ